MLTSGDQGGDVAKVTHFHCHMYLGNPGVPYWLLKYCQFCFRGGIERGRSPFFPLTHPLDALLDFTSG